MTVMSIGEAQAKLREVIENLAPGEKVVITKDNQPVAHLTAVRERQSKDPRQPGTMRGTVLYMAPDFDAPLDDFKEYMEQPRNGEYHSFEEPNR